MIRFYSEVYEDVDVPAAQDNVYINVEDGTGAFVCGTSDRNSTADSNDSTGKQYDNGYTSLMQREAIPSPKTVPTSSATQSIPKKQIAFTVILILISITIILVVLMVVVIQPGFSRSGEYY